MNFYLNWLRNLLPEKSKNGGLDLKRFLEQINEPNDIKKINKENLPELAEQIRKFLIKNVGKTGGHLASNLGAVEVTMALHLCMNFPQDKLIFDVGHQSYTHKILTGRRKEFDTLRNYQGISGFPKEEESSCDAFNTGHSSTSVSVALGYAKARQIQHQNYKVAAVIGDGALTGGMSFEALNNAGRHKGNMVIVLNDNNMSISENVGGMASYLGKVRTGETYAEFKDNVENALRKLPKLGDKIADKLKQTKDSIKGLVVPGMLFEEMGITYIGPIDGHDLELLVKAFHTAFAAKTPVLVHVVTKKGKGYRHAEENSPKFHGIEPFDPKTGEILNPINYLTYTECFSNKIVELAKKDSKIVTVTAAMPSGTGLSAFAKEFPDRICDVGIAEEHAVTFAAGMAAAGLKPVVAVYSTFLQRAYDQIIHDVCLTGKHVVFAVDRAGIVGKDGSTHQGVYDLSYLTHIPGLTVMAPGSDRELNHMLEMALSLNEPVAIRYPRGRVLEELVNEVYDDYSYEDIKKGKGYIIHKGNERQDKKVAICYIGSLSNKAYELYKLLMSEGIDGTVVNLRFAAPLDTHLLDQLIEDNDVIVTLEDNIESGGVGEAIAAYIGKKNCKNTSCIIGAISNEYIEHGDRELLLDLYGLDMKRICKKVLECI
ncbi:MAG: 1-deoxy-D-xylulose-5-phosphate synthase [Lachnospiraceae bacterium]|nr:1-deoxy-D-xylulose-5-phosphate synthase [Lachnospiraceae bacterium]